MVISSSYYSVRTNRFRQFNRCTGALRYTTITSCRTINIRIGRQSAKYSSADHIHLLVPGSFIEMTSRHTSNSHGKNLTSPKPVLINEPSSPRDSNERTNLCQNLQALNQIKSFLYLSELLRDFNERTIMCH